MRPTNRQYNDMLYRGILNTIQTSNRNCKKKEVQNPKFELRNPKQDQISEIPIFKTTNKKMIRD